MKSTKLLMTLLVVVLILSFAITTVVAQGEIPPVGEVDEDGDLIVDIFPQVEIDPAGAAPFEEALTLPEGSVGVESIPAYPVDDQFVYTKYPTFVFSQDAGAFKYRIEVYNLMTDPNTLLYTIKGSGNCVGGVCTLTPVFPLKPYDLTDTKGYYGWHVQSKTASGWGGWSEPAYFYVLKNGFNSTFTTLDSKWWPVYGTWTITSTGYAKTKGEIDILHSAIEKHTVTEGFVYEVKMKHKDDPSASNRVYFLAYPWELDFDKAWNDGYIFIIRNTGQWQLIHRIDGISTQLTTDNSPYIIPYGWNKVTVMVGDTFVDYWINGTYIGYVVRADTFELGYAGFGAFSEIGNEAFLVDYAKLEYTTNAPYPWPWSITSDGLRDPAYEMFPSEVTLGEDLTVIP